MAGTNHQYRDLCWTTADGLKLHARDYPGRGGAEGEGDGLLPVVCLPGLTRNARDYDGLAARLAPGRRVIAVSLRGRGESAAAKDPATYVPATYVADVLALFAHAGIGRAAFVGTSLGGLVTALLAARAPGAVAGALINDIGWSSGWRWPSGCTG